MVNVDARIGALLLVVRDAAQSAAWYESVLGCRVTRTQGPFAYLDAGGFLLVLQESENEVVPSATQFVVFTVPDSGKAYSELQSRGVAFTVPLVPFFDDNFGANFDDPDGHHLTIMGPKVSE